MSDELTKEDRRALLALWCKVAWADDVIENNEREQLARLWEELGEGAVTRAEISQWLSVGVDFEPDVVSDSARSLFVQKALELARSDGEVMPDEIQTIRELREAFFAASQDNPAASDEQE